jgi:hypothetical protein
MTRGTKEVARSRLVALHRPSGLAIVVGEGSSLSATDRRKGWRLARIPRGVSWAGVMKRLEGSR